MSNYDIMAQSKEKRLWQNMSWKKVEHAKKKIQKAGRAIAKSDFDKIVEKEAREVINNWRASHAYPLHIFYKNLKKKAKIYKNSIVAQRLKRLDSILIKLRNNPDMSLVRMQDLGGCRVIVDNVLEVYKFRDEFRKSKIKHKFDKEDDYIKAPKFSGYRGIHLIYKYFSDKKEDYNGMFVEIQIRTKLQHLWATAVEVLGFYTKHNLKASQGDKDILRYMELISALFALEENSNLSNDVPQTKEKILQELRSLKDANVIDILAAVRIAIPSAQTEKFEYFILKIDFEQKQLTVSGFKKVELDKATEEYEKIEKENNSDIDAVLVSVADINTLKKAYPNYFADVDEIRNKISGLLKN